MSRFARVVAFWSVLTLLSCGPVAAFGINQPGLAWVKPETEWKRIIDAMSASGARDVRVMLVESISNTTKVAEYATRRGMGVLLMLPLTQLSYYPTGTVRREGKGSIWPAPPLSRMNINLVQNRIRTALQQFALSGVRITGIEVANEFNSAAFNGDLPIVKGGVILGVANHRAFAFWTAYSAGMMKLVEAIAVVKAARAESQTYGGVPVVLGGLARPATDWLASQDASLVEPDLALRTVLDLGAARYVDAFAIHLYPRVATWEWRSPLPAIVRHIDEQMAPLIKVSGWKKPWWITEWGFAPRDIYLGVAGVDRRLPLFTTFIQAMKKSRFSGAFGPTYIYDWSESDRFRIWDGRSVLGIKDFARCLETPQPAGPCAAAAGGTP